MYDVNFVGLVCFYKQEDGRRLALLPDGRNPDPAQNIAKHVARIVVATDRIVAGTNWESGVKLLRSRMEFELPECAIRMSVNDGLPLTLDTSKHDDRVPNLKKLDGNFAIDPPTVRAIAKFELTQGKIEAFRRPGSNDENPDVALVTRLSVPHEGPIEIKVQPSNGDFERTISLLPNTEIVISNIEEFEDPNKSGRHIRLYETLSSNPVNLDKEDNKQLLSSLGQPKMHSTHPFFGIAGTIGSGADCGNSGCCPSDPPPGP